jgi:hypothetical protein
MEINSNTVSRRSKDSLQFRKATPSIRGNDTSSKSRNQRREHVVRALEKGVSIKGVKIVNPIMEFIMDEKAPRRICTACREKEPSSVHIQPKNGNRPQFALFAFESLTLPDGRSFGELGSDAFTTFIYQCLKCNHLDFYGLPFPNPNAKR